MKVDIKIDHQEWDADSYSMESLQISENDGAIKHKIQIVQGEPEDMIFGRDLPSVEDIVPMLRMAFDAGAKGESLTINYID